MKTFMPLLASSLCLFSTVLMAQVPLPGNTYAPPASSSQAYAPQQIHWLTNYDEAVSLAQQSSKPIVMLFTGTTWCPPCQQLERKVIHHPAFAQAVGNRFIFLKLEFIDPATANSPYKFLVDRYNIQNFPTMIVVQPNGQFLFQVNCMIKQPEAVANQLLR